MHGCLYIIIITAYTYYGLDDWRCDQYRWEHSGRKKIPKKDPAIVKTYFVNVSSDGKNINFKRHAYNLIEDLQKQKTLIHYLGDHTSAKDFSHGNANNERIHVRTCPSKLEDMSNAIDKYIQEGDNEE